MLSDEQKRVALKKNMEAMGKEAKKHRANGVEGITLTYYADEESFQKMRLEVETEDFAFRQMMTIETAKLMIKHGLDIEVQVLNRVQFENHGSASREGGCPGPCCKWAGAAD